ncbi:MAG: hypothetical protein ACRCW0_08970 [Clostridium sp.]
METFKVNKVFENTKRYEDRKLFNLLKTIKYVFGDECSSVDDYIYIQNLYNYYNTKCTIDNIKIYAINSNKFYVISSILNGVEQTIRIYNLSDIETIDLKQLLRYEQPYLSLSLKFKCGDSYTLDCFEDTFEDIMSLEMSEVISVFFNKLN